MHAVRRKRAFAATESVDRLAEGLSKYCPFSALVVLSLLIAGPAVPRSRAAAIFAAFAAVDVGVNLFRRRRVRTRRRGQSGSIQRSVLA